MVNGGGVDSPLQEGHSGTLRGGQKPSLRQAAYYDGRDGNPVTFMIGANGL